MGERSEPSNSGQARGFAPIAKRDARILILGSMPGQVSLPKQQYYAHAQNAFWPIMGKLLGFEPQMPYARRIAALREAGIALWDVLLSCSRPGSLDSAIVADSAQVNDFASFVRRYRGLRTLLFNGATAESLFRRHVLPDLDVSNFRLRRLPSTSPAHASLGFENKLRQWRDAVAPFLKD